MWDNQYVVGRGTKTRVCANNNTELGPAISIWLARDKSFEFFDM